MPALLLAFVLSGVAASPDGAVATAHPAASEAGAAVLRAGGNAADAAVAAAFALSVAENHRTGIGGGGFALVWVARERKVHVLDFREVAPRAATRDMFVRDGKPDPRLAQEGGLAVAVPSASRGYAELARRFGTQPLARLVEPAARLAERGYRMTVAQHLAAVEQERCLRADPGAAREFLVERRGERVAPTPGALVVRPDLARTLRLLGRDPDAMHRGPLARRIVAAVRARGGILTEEDLARYRVREREPLWGAYRGHRVASLPPPSAGGAIVIGLLQALEAFDPREGGYRPERFLHAFVELERRLYARRAGPFGDPEHVPAAGPAAAEMISPGFARALAGQVTDRATPSEGVEPPRSGERTSHLSVVDRDGNAVALTTTVNGYFGSCVVVPGTGILLNDEMDDFDAAPGVANQYGAVGTGANAVAGGKVPLSSMAPTLVFDPEGRLLLATGSSGGTTIPSTVAQVIVNVVDHGMRLDDALGAPRISGSPITSSPSRGPWTPTRRPRCGAAGTSSRPASGPSGIRRR